MHILFVCTGNICRSPTAERLAAAYLAERGHSGIVLSSAGTKAVVGHPLHPEAASVLRRLGGDDSNFAARQLRPKLIAEADLILTMTVAHRSTVLELAPHRLKAAFTLCEAAQLITRHQAASTLDLADLRVKLTDADSLDIRDPIGESAETFEEVGYRISKLIEPILNVFIQ